jgi:hypothetical protein
VMNFSNNAACRGGALLRAKFIGYLGRRYPDSMANLYYSNNSYNDVVHDREAL